MKTKVPFALMVKPVGSSCNMRCRYCYYIDNDCSQHAVMDEEQLETMIRNYFESTCGPVVSLVWHGGEPTLRGLDFYRKAVELERKYLPEGWQCWNNLQTNGLALDEQWCSFLKENGFDVGLSIDGTQAVHDFFRSTADGRNTYERIRENIRLLQKHGIQPDLLCTVNSETVKYPAETYEALKQLNTGWIQFIPIVNHDDRGNVLEYSVEPGAYGEFLCRVFDEWLKDYRTVGVQLFMELLNMYAGGQPSLCWLQETCGSVPVVESDGMIYSCDHYVSEAHCIGSLDMPFAQMVQGEKQVIFGNSKKAGLSDKCQKCRYLKLCNGGCPKDRFLPGNENYLCEGLLLLLEHSEKPFKNILMNMKGRQHGHQ